MAVLGDLKAQISLKVVEILLLIVALATFFSTVGGWGFYVTSIIVGCFINAIVFLGLYLAGFSQLQQTPLELILNTYYGIGLFVSSILLMATDLTPTMVTSGVFCLLLTPVYCVDWYLCYIKFNNQLVSFRSGVNPPTATPGLDPSTLSPPQPYGIFPPPYQGPANVVDTGVTTLAPSSLYVTNPTYPPASDHPPTNLDRGFTYPPEVSQGPRP